MGKTPAPEYDKWLASLTIEQIEVELIRQGCSHVLVKVMTGNQGNTKQQIYCGSDYNQISRLPMGEPVAYQGTSNKKSGKGKAIFRAPLKLYWLEPHSFEPLPAPNSKLIFYPQYPEVRLSGFIKGCKNPPISLLSIDKRGKEDRRTLLLGVSSDSDKVIGLMLPPEAKAIDQILAATQEEYGPFRLWQIKASRSSMAQLLDKLTTIVGDGPQPGLKLRKDGTAVPYKASNAGGYTLEARFGVSPNGDPMPDFLDWELKAHKVSRLDPPISSGRLTLMTPEPDGGVYRDAGVQEFLERFGYQRRSDRWDFAGTIAVGAPPHKTTGVELKLLGYRNSKDFDHDGSVAAIHNGTIIASWSFEKLLGHWSRKHSRTAYVPYGFSNGKYEYGRWCSFGEGTTFAHLLGAFEKGLVVWDPGIKSELQPTGLWKSKRRNQFRTHFKDLHNLYEIFRTEDVLST